MTTGLLKSIFSITPNNGFISRWTKYSFAWSFKLSAAVLRRLKLKKNYPVDVFSAAKEFESQLANLDVKKIKHDASKPRIILLGPYHFKQPMWSVRASAALPDLIEPLSQIAEVHLITPIPNAFALKDTSDLIQKYRIHHHLLEPNFNLKTIQHKGDILDSLINHIKPQVIMNTFGVSASGFDAVTCAKRNAIKSVLRVPGNEVLAREKILNNNSIQSSAEKKQQKTDLKKVNFAIQNSDKVLVMSSNEEQRIIQVRKSDKGVLIQIRGVNIEAFNPKMSVGFNKSKALNVGFVGRLTMEKGTDILLETMDMLSSNCNIIFHIASPENIKAEIKQKNKNLIWHGYVPHEEVPILMKSFDVLILPSHMEGRSQTMMEAMACGLPVLLQEKIHPELLPGMVHCNENIQTFVDALNELARDQKKLIKLSEEARQSAIKYFDKSIWSKEMVKTFQEFLKGN